MAGAGAWEAASKMLGTVANADGSLAAWSLAKEGFQGKQATIDEEQRRLKLMQDQELGHATAAAAASGLDPSSRSFTNYLSFMKSEMERQAAWTRKAKEDELARAREANNWQLGMSIAGSILDMGGSAGQLLAGASGGSSERDLSVRYDQLWSQESSGGVAGGAQGPGGSTYDAALSGFKLSD